MAQTYNLPAALRCHDVAHLQILVFGAESAEQILDLCLVFLRLPAAVSQKLLEEFLFQSQPSLQLLHNLSGTGLNSGDEGSCEILHTHNTTNRAISKKLVRQVCRHGMVFQSFEHLHRKQLRIIETESCCKCQCVPEPPGCVSVVLLVAGL